MISYSEIRKEIKKSKKTVILLFIFFQTLNNALFGTLGYFNMDLAYRDYLDVVCITILFVASWEYFNYFYLFRSEILKKVPNVRVMYGTFIRGIYLLIEASILIYQIVTCLYFVLLTNQNVNHKTLNCYLKLLFILFVFKILGSSCQKYLKKLMMSASLFALISYDWYVFIIIITVEAEEQFFDFFMIIFIFTHIYFFGCCYYLYKEWNLYRFDIRRPRPIYGVNGNDLINNGSHSIKIGLTDEIEKVVCTICTFDVIKGDQIFNIPCGHTFHSKCLVPWLQINKVCPNCRQGLVISEENAIVMENNNIIQEQELGVIGGHSQRLNFV